MKIRSSAAVIRGGATNGEWKVRTERGLVYDYHTNTHVSGMNIEVGHITMTVTDAQAERIAEYILGEFMLDELDEERAAAMERHPSNRKAYSEDE